MVVYVLLREDQDEHGYVDSSIGGVFGSQTAAMNELGRARERARAAGLRICDEEESDPDWQVDWKVEPHVVEPA